MDLGDALVERASAETGLPRARIEGERARTVGQLKLFAEVVRRGEWLDLRIDPALPERKPLPRPDLRLRNIALGPGRCVRREQLPARLLGRRRRHRLGARGWLSRGGQGASGPSRNGRTRRPGAPGRGRVIRPARGRVLASLGRDRDRFGAGRQPAHQGGRVHGLARGRRGARAYRGRAARADPGLRRDEQHQPRLSPARCPVGARGRRSAASSSPR